jgi:hypothetical protein
MMTLTGNVTAGEVRDTSAAGTVDPGSLHKGAAIACIFMCAADILLE